jgi:pimeloyl-ACP methyl ester carboxylesterase
MAFSSDLGNEGFADSGGVRIHYVTRGTGPLVILLHGIPGFWYDWRHQMPALASHFQVVAIDQRGFNLSDQPAGVTNYAFDKLIDDVDAVSRHFGRQQATLVGHDSGGWISWRYAMAHPDRTHRLVVLNLPHPGCIERELANNPRQHNAADYARQFQQTPEGSRAFVASDGSTIDLTPELYASAFKDDQPEYLEAFRRTSIDAMINFYKANYPRPPYQEQTYPSVRCPVLMIHGLDDPWLMPEALNDTWRHLHEELTLVTVPKAGHWVHLDAANLVTTRMLSWLTRDSGQKDR